MSNKRHARSGLAGYVDSTILDAGTREEDVEVLCFDARRYRFRAVCVNPVWVDTARRCLEQTGVAVCSVIAFPLGAQLTSVKVFEAEQVIEKGASEIDVVINIGAVRSGDWKLVKVDLEAVVGVCQSHGACSKAILEMCLLTEEEKRRAVEVVIGTGVDYVKTSTGFSRRGATLKDVRKLAEWSDGRVRIKAAGGIKSRDEAWRMIEAGAARIGTSRATWLIKEG